MSAFVVCGTCQDIRGGPIAEVDGVEVLQLCRCSSTEDHRAQPRAGDLNRAFELCRCCGLEALPSGSRWSVWFCRPCKDQVRALNNRAGRCGVPIGRHSLMNQVVLDPFADVDVSVPTFTGHLTSMFERIKVTGSWAAAVVELNLEALGLPPDDDVDLDAYLAAVGTLTSIKTQRFSQMVDRLARADAGEAQAAGA